MKLQVKKRCLLVFVKIVRLHQVRCKACKIDKIPITFILIVGGCKHGVAFLFWLHRRSSEPSVTSTKCYWRKAKLSKVNEKEVNLQSLVGGTVPQLSERNPTIVAELVAALPANVGGVFDIENEVKYSNISVYQMYLTYKNVHPESERSAESFMNYMCNKMDNASCKEVEELSRNQSKSTLWYEMKFARITASRLYESARCSTFEGSLRESIMGATPPFETDATVRGKKLEWAVIQAVSKKRSVTIKKSGIFLKRQYPILGASPDGVTDEYCIEVKCPTKESVIKNYLVDGVVQKKFYYQIQLQMLMADRKKGLFCVASPDFESSGNVSVVEVAFNEEDCMNIIAKATEFWKSAVYNSLNKI